MKKVLLLAAVLLCGWQFAKASFVTPTGSAGSLATADYGGVYTATSAFSVSGTTVCVTYPCTGVVYGAWFSTGGINFATSPDFVDVYDSTDARIAYLGQDKSIRIYNTQTFLGSTSTASGFSGPPKPVRFFKGLIFRPSSNGYNNINILYYQEP